MAVFIRWFNYENWGLEATYFVDIQLQEMGKQIDLGIISLFEAKGHLITKYPFGFFKSTKKT